MKHWLKIVSIIGLTVITQTAYPAAVTDTFTTGDTLTAKQLNNIKSAVNDNDTRIDSISSCTVTKNADIASITCSSESGDESIASVSDGTTVTGNAQGDMQFFDGGDWVLVPAPAENAASLSFCNGVPTWTQGAGACHFAIGDAGPAGGIVFHVTDGGLHGLEAAAVDQVSTEWGCYGTTISGANGTAVGTGEQNTADIIAGCSETTAASVASAYGPDWYLPSKDELNLLYVQKVADIVGGFASGSYWSSSQYGSHHAWVQLFDGGNQEGTFKDFTYRVRAVRSF